MLELATREAVTKEELEELVISSREMMMLLEPEELDSNSGDTSDGEEEDFF